MSLQVLIKGIILGYVEQACILGHGDLIRKDHWEKQPEYDYEPTIRMYGLRIVWINYDCVGIHKDTKTTCHQATNFVEFHLF